MVPFPIRAHLHTSLARLQPSPHTSSASSTLRQTAFQTLGDFSESNTGEYSTLYVCPNFMEAATVWTLSRTSFVPCAYLLSFSKGPHTLPPVLSDRTQNIRGFQWMCATCFGRLPTTVWAWSRIWSVSICTPLSSCSQVLTLHQPPEFLQYSHLRVGERLVILGVS